MTATTPDLTGRLGALSATLAKATKACPGRVRVNHGHDNDGQMVYTDVHPEFCDDCQGTDEVAMFPEFRQVCDKHWMRAPTGKLYPGWITHKGWLRSDVHGAECICNGLGWEISAGSMADGLAGLTPEQKVNFAGRFQALAYHWENQRAEPDAGTIEAKALELVAKIKNLKVA